jgi:hypothetical protein
LLLVSLLTCSAFAADEPRVFVTGENSFQVNGPSGEEHISATGNSTVAEGIKLFHDNCPSVQVNMRRDLANYIVSVTDDGHGAARKSRRASSLYSHWRPAISSFRAKSQECCKGHMRSDAEGMVSEESPIVKVETCKIPRLIMAVLALNN